MDPEVGNSPSERRRSVERVPGYAATWHREPMRGLQGAGQRWKLAIADRTRRLLVPPAPDVEEASTDVTGLVNSVLRLTETLLTERDELARLQTDLRRTEDDVRRLQEDRQVAREELERVQQELRAERSRTFALQTELDKFYLAQRSERPRRWLHRR